MFDIGERRLSPPRTALELLRRGVAPALSSVREGAEESSGGGGGGSAGESDAERVPTERLPPWQVEEARWEGSLSSRLSSTLWPSHPTEGATIGEVACSIGEVACSIGDHCGEVGCAVGVAGAEGSGGESSGGCSSSL